MMNRWKNILKFGIKSAIVWKKGFDSEPEYNENYIKTKINLYAEKINTNFHGDKVPEEGF